MKAADEVIEVDREEIKAVLERARQEPTFTQGSSKNRGL